MKNKTEISVIVPVYNVEPYLRRCIDSILAQTFADFDLILVDDGSPDNCGTICDEYAAKDSRITVIHKQNGGLSDARNEGIDWAFANSSSEWLTFIDSDDWVHIDYLSFLLKAAIDNNAFVSVCNYSRPKSKDECIKCISESVSIQNNYDCIIVPSEEFYCRDDATSVIACGKLYSKKAFSDIRFPLGKIHEDVFTTYLLLFYSKNVAFVNLPLYYYFFNQKGITKKAWDKCRMDEIDGFLEQIDYFEKKGFTKAYKTALLRYIIACNRSLSGMINCFPNEKQEIEELLVKQKKAVKEYQLLDDIPKPLLAEIESTTHYKSLLRKKWFKRKLRHIKEFFHRL